MNLNIDKEYEKLIEIVKQIFNQQKYNVKLELGSSKEQQLTL